MQCPSGDEHFVTNVEDNGAVAHISFCATVCAEPFFVTMLVFLETQPGVWTYGKDLDRYLIGPLSEDSIGSPGFQNDF